MTLGPTPCVAFTLRPELPSVPAARHRVVAVLRSIGLASVDVGELLTSEVVSNAVEHAVTDVIEVRVSAGASRVRVEVEDRDQRLPTPRTPTPEALRGRGLPILDAYAAAWGAERLPGLGKVVWFELPVHR
ncbi:MAG: ATP-binding protein [Acidimicrobiales bacterium]